MDATLVVGSQLGGIPLFDQLVYVAEGWGYFQGGFKILLSA